MLINFGVSNLFSFKNKIVFSLLPGQSQKHKSHLTKASPFNLLRGSVFYGANAAGKSNFFNAVALFRSIIEYGTIPPFLAQYQFKLGTEENKTVFEITFQTNGTLYQYEVAINLEEVFYEKLVRLHKTNNTEDLIFERKSLEVNVGKLIKNGTSDKNWYNERTFQKNMLFLTKLRFDGIRENRSIIKGSNFIIDTLDFLEKISVWKSDSIVKPDIFFNTFKLDDYKKFLLDLLKKADTGITDIKWVELSENETETLWQQTILTNPVLLNMPAQNFLGSNTFLFRDKNNFYTLYMENNKKIAKSLKTFHWNDIPFSLDQESSGTQRLIELSLGFYKLLKDDRTCFVDELDNSLHPILTKYLIQRFFEHKSESQLIVSMHDINLLDNKIWRPDEIWFVEKDLNGASDIYSLNQFKPRFDKKIVNDYCKGKYGAIPMIGRLKI